MIANKSTGLRSLSRFILLIGSLIYIILFALFPFSKVIGGKDFLPFLSAFITMVIGTVLIALIPIFIFINKWRVAKTIFVVLFAYSLLSITYYKLQLAQNLFINSDSLYVTGVVFSLTAGLVGVFSIIVLLIKHLGKKDGKVITTLGIISLLAFIVTSFLSGIVMISAYGTLCYHWSLIVKEIADSLILPTILTAGYIVFLINGLDGEELPPLFIKKSAITASIVVFSVTLGTTWIVMGALGLSGFRAAPYGYNAAAEKSDPVAYVNNSHLYYASLSSNNGTVTETQYVISEFDTYKIKKHGDIPYVSVETFYESVYIPLLASSNEQAEKLNIDYSANENASYTFKNKYSEMNVDVFNDIIVIEDTPFFMLNDERNDWDVSYMVASGFEPDICKIKSDSETVVARKKNIKFNLGKYHIDLLAYNSTVYVPIQTMLDMFIGSNLISIIFNGRDLYITNSFGGKGLEANESSYEYKCYNESPWKNVANREKNLAKFNYYEMCFALDKFYGLKDYRKISSFDDYITNLGLKGKLLSSNSLTYEEALIKFVCRYLSEGHTSFTQVSPFTISHDFKKYKESNSEKNKRLSVLKDTLTGELLKRREALNIGVGLRTYKNTAIITFDGFNKMNNTGSLYQDVDNYSYEVLHDNDSYLFFYKAFKEIENNKEIKNVVVDMTLNGGGATNAMPLVEAFFTNDPFYPFRNILTGEITNVKYSVDLNHDGKFNDSYSGKYNFFVMTSNGSFSCGNAFPTAVKAGKFATLIGERSGGGACIVGQLSLACGSYMRTSSIYQFGTIKGTSYTINEGGIKPDHEFPREDFYDDNAVYEFVNKLAK